MYVFQINESAIDQMLVFESSAKQQKVVLAFLIGLEVETILLNFFKSNSIDIKFAFSVLNRPSTQKRMLNFLPILFRDWL